MASREEVPKCLSLFFWKVSVISKEGRARPLAPVLLLVLQRLRTLGTFLHDRGVETVSPVGHGHLRSDSSTVLSDQMSERTPEYLKCYLGDISAWNCPTAKYDLWNRISILQTVHICIHLVVSDPFYTWNLCKKSAVIFRSDWLSWGLTNI